MRKLFRPAPGCSILDSAENKTQLVGECLQGLAITTEQLAHCAIPALLEDHIRREPGKIFNFGIRDKNIKIHLLLER
jgi:hypothetical protein